MSYRSWLLPASRRVVLALTVALGLATVAPHGDHVYAVDNAADLVVATARSLVGSPYAYIGDDPGTGFSCIGFVHYIYAQIGINVPYDLGVAHISEPRVGFAHLQPGDLVFFSNTVWIGLSHVALYAGDGQIIGADTYTTGVEVTRLSDPYWLAHYSGATRPLAALAATPQAPQVTATPRPTAAPNPTPPRPTATPHPTPTATVAPAPTPTMAPAVRVGDLLRARIAGAAYSGPGYIYPRIDRLAPRTSMRVTGMQGTWANVAYQTDGVEYDGWIDRRYLAQCIVTPGSGGRRRR